MPAHAPDGETTESTYGLLRAVREAGVAEAGADGEHPPVLHVRHVRQLAETLNHRIVMHDHDGIVVGNLGDRLAQLRREIEALHFPVSRQVLPASLDGAIRADHAGTADADEGRELE